MSELNGIDISGFLNYQMIHPRLHTSGQPTAEQLILLREAGVETLINLALTDASNSLIKQQQYEDRIALELGMEYVQLPLLWDQPSPFQALLILKFIHYLDERGQTIWIHCAKNWRVSSLMYLYRQYYMQIPQDEAEVRLHEIWQPNATWTGLIHATGIQVRAEIG